MQFGYSVDGMAAKRSQMRHANAGVPTSQLFRHSKRRKLRDCEFRTDESKLGVHSNLKSFAYSPRIDATGSARIARCAGR